MSDIFPIAVPKWGIEMVEGTINTWNKQPGDPVSKGDEVFEMESDKIVNVWEAPAAGILRRVLAQEGETAPVGALLGIIAAADVDDAAIDTFIADFAQSAAPAAEPAATAAAAGASDAATRSSPSVRRLAQELGVDLNTVEGTGRLGRVTDDEVRTAASQSGGGEEGAAEADVIPLSPTRKTIAKRLTKAKQEIPHFYLTVDYELDALIANRAALNEKAAVKISLNDMIVHRVAKALMREPRVNVNLVGDDIHQFHHANIAVAIATEDGLYPATIRTVETLAPDEITQAVAQLADKAKQGKLTQEDISGGSFTVSNLGMFGVSSFTAIINPPMGAILALGKAEQRMVVRDGKPEVATVVTATLSCDHRVIDGAVGAKFMQILGEEIAQ